MKLYYIKTKFKRYQYVGKILAEYLNLDMIIMDEKEIINNVKKEDLVYYETLTHNIVPNICTLIGADMNIIKKWNNKIYQYDNLKHIVKVPDYKTYKNIMSLIIDINLIKQEYDKFIIFDVIGAGGLECLVCDKKTKTSDIFTKFKQSKNRFRVSKFIPDVLTLGLHYIIADKNKFWLAPIVDKNMEEYIYFRGGIYPSIISESINNKVMEEASKVVEILSNDGYVGLGHLDFMISNGDIIFTEINPRTAGSTPGVSYMMEDSFNYSIPIIEYYAIKEKRILDIKQLKPNKSWKYIYTNFIKNPPNNPGDERELFKDKKGGSVTFNEYFKTHSFTIDVIDHEKI